MEARQYPFAAVTGVGSLPVKDAGDAMALVQKYCPEVPFWPQLPKHSSAEHMIVHPIARFWDYLDLSQLSSGTLSITRVRVDAFCKLLENGSPELNREVAPGFFECKSVLQKAMKKPPFVKAQSVGPVTWLQCLQIGNEPALRFADIALCLVDYLSRHIVWQIEQLKSLGQETIFVLDEPMLQSAIRTAGRDYGVLRGALKHAITQIQSSGALVGLHSCAQLIDFEMFEFNADVISFSCSETLMYPDNFWSSEDMQQFLVRGGFLALGFDTDSVAETEKEILECFQETGLDKNQVVRQTLLTAPCGYGTLSLTAAKQSFEFLSQLSLRLREGWGGN